LPATVRDKIESKIANQTREKGGAVVGGAVGGYFGGPAGAQAGAAIGPQLEIYSRELGNKIESFFACKVNADDKIGEIVEAYTAPSFGAGPHEVKSNAGDFTLRYTISVQRVS